MNTRHIVRLSEPVYYNYKGLKSEYFASLRNISLQTVLKKQNILFDMIKISLILFSFSIIYSSIDAIAFDDFHCKIPTCRTFFLVSSF